MHSVKIISDSSCDLPEELIKKHDITIVPFLVSFDGSLYYKENIEITNKEFYKTLRTKKDVYPKTSLPTIDDYAEEFRKYTAMDMDVICFSITSKFSGSHQSAVNAAELINDELGCVRVYAVDSMHAAASQGAVVLEAAKMKDAGLNASEIYGKINILKETCVMYITVDSLAYLQKGGRIGKANALAGSLLNIKPIMVLKDGELQPIAKVRGRKKALNELGERVAKDTGAKLNEYEYFAAQADVRDEIEAFTSACEREYGITLSFPLSEVGVTIGAHTGPTAVGYGYIKKYTML